MTLNDGTEITLTSETSSSDAPSNSVGNNHFFRPFTDNNTTADNIQAALNAVTGLTVANPAANVVTVTRDDHGSMNLNVVTQDSTRLAVTNFSSNPLQVRIEPFIFSDDERYIVAFSAGQIEVFLLDPTNNFNPKKFLQLHKTQLAQTCHLHKQRLLSCSLLNRLMLCLLRISCIQY